MIIWKIKNRISLLGSSRMAGRILFFILNTVYSRKNRFPLADYLFDPLKKVTGVNEGKLGQ